MAERVHKKIPFVLSRNDRTSLTDQMVIGFRSAIESGYYQEGEILPPLKTIAERLGVSMIVSRGALRRLADEGLLLPHPGRGSEVLGRGTVTWKGRVLFVMPDRNDSYHVSVVCDILRRRLLSAGYFFNQITVTKDAHGNYDTTQLQLRLKDPDLFVVEMFAVPEISREVVASGVRSVVVARDASGYPGARVVRFASDAAVPEFVARCLRAGVRRVLQIGFEYGFADATSSLHDAGISVDSVYVSAPVREPGVIEAVKRSTHDFFSKFIARGTPLPDLFYFTDDHAAEAGLLSLALAGIRVPQDVRVVAWSNRGLAPVYPKPVTRMEIDPIANGDQLSDYVLGLLGGNQSADVPVMAPSYVAGETFTAT